MWHVGKFATIRKKPPLSGVLRTSIFLLLALFIMAPLLEPGYILTLDMVFTPQLRMPAIITNDFLFRSLLHFLNFIVPADEIEKTILVVILLLSSFGVSRLLRSFSQTETPIENSGIVFAAILYTVNPFTYDRFMTGQYEVLLGYALLPWFTCTLLNFLANPGRKRVVALICWSIITSIVSIHAVGAMALMTVVATITYIWVRRRDAEWRKRLIRYGTLALVIFLGLSSYWLLPLAINQGPIAATVSNFSMNDRLAFATVGHGWFGKIGNALQLQGFWAEPLGLYKLPQTNLPSWEIITLMVLVISGIGLVSYWRTGQRSLVLIFGAGSAISILLAVGLFNGWLTAHIPLFNGYREPEKLLVIWCLAFAIFSARGATSIIQYARTQGGKSFLLFSTLLILLLPLVWTHTMFWGFNDQLATSFYPADWAAVNRHLDADKNNFQTLVLPWHLYMYFDFAGRDIANPVPSYFDKPMLISDNPEFRGAAASRPTRAKQQLNNLLSHANDTSQLGNELATLNIKYILLAKDDDYANYSYLDKQPQLTLVGDSGTLKLYRNNAWR